MYTIIFEVQVNIKKNNNNIETLRRYMNYGIMNAQTKRYITICTAL